MEIPQLLQKINSIKTFGNSMMPLLLNEDVVYFKKISFSKIQINDIVVVNKSRLTIIHRVIYKSSSYIVTKGDHNHKADGKIYPKQIMGVANRINRKGHIYNIGSLYLLQSTLYLKEIIRIKKEFDHQNINYVFLKGLPLHLYLEKTHPKRLYLDCDVLIKRDDYLKAKKILIQFGYQKVKTELSTIYNKIKDKNTENGYFKIINSMPVIFDLHLEVIFMMTQLGKLEALYPQKLIDQFTQEILQTKRTVKIQNTSFSILYTPYLIIYLALHFFHHNFRGAFRLEFLDKISRKEQINNTSINRLIEMIKKYRLQNFIYPVFILLKKLHNTPIPSRFLKSIRPSLPILRYQSLIVNHPMSVFDDQPRIKAGVNRFKNLFSLSPRPWWKKSLVFLNPQVIYSIFWFFQRRLSSSFLEN